MLVHPLPQFQVQRQVHRSVRPRVTNKEALEQVEKATESEPVKGADLLESKALKRQLSEDEERYRSGLSPKKAKSKAR
jgi:hypothetical protein